MTVLLREATINDIELLLSWRNNPLIWKGLYSQSLTNRPLTWEEHSKWWNSRPNWQRFIIQVNDGISTRSVGYVYIGQLDNWKPEIGIVVGEISLWGKGVGKQALLLGLEWLKKNGYRACHGSILKENEKTIKMFKSVGFKLIGDARVGELEYEIRI